MSCTCSTEQQALACGVDPAQGGTPFTRLSYNDGMLLGAEDFALEQRSHLWRVRLHNALLHGAGTVYGLMVEVLPDGRLRISPGLALDPRGRELYVGRALCLDVRGLPQDPVFWSELSAGEGQAWVVLRYEACQGEAVPAIRPTCAEPEAGETWSRLYDRCVAEIVTEPPPPPLAALRAWLGRGSLGDPGEGGARWLGADPPDAEDLRARLLDLLLGPASSIEELWAGDAPVPLVLASLRLETGEDGLGRVVPESVDNRIRAILPAVQLVAERALGTELTREPGPRALVTATAIRWVAGAVEIQLSAPLNAASYAGVQLFGWSAGGWVQLPLESPIETALSGRVLRVRPADPTALGDGDLAQILLYGVGALALLGANGEPFGGDALDPNPLNRSRDLAVIYKWSGP